MIILTIEDAEEAYNYGFAVTYDGDRHQRLHGAMCNVCGEYFEDETISVYCSKCKEELWKQKQL